METGFWQILEAHLKRYPLMEPQDFGKLVFQGEFGPEHMVSDGQQAESFLIEEWMELSRDRMDSNRQDKQEPVVQVSESMCRFPLSSCGFADEARLLAHLFTTTAGECRGTTEGLEEKLELLKALRIPGMEAWVAAWKQEGYPPVHHSQVYREVYQPHYRLVRKEYGDYFPVLSEIYRLMQGGKTAVVAIDGRCGSGKTYLAALIGRLFPCNICHMDDFYLPMEQRGGNWMEIPGGNMDLERFLAEVLRPARAGQGFLYRPYHCRKGRMEEAVWMPSCKLTVVEGSYSHHPALAAKYDLTIFLTCSGEEQRKRLQAREGSYYPVFENMWIPMEENYLRQYPIETSSHLVMDTSDYQGIK